jgi:F-type H+-transporting ATPase subunit delta
MAELSTLARPYAQALYAAAAEAGPAAGAAWLPVVQALADAASHPEVSRLMSDPAVSDDKRAALLLDIARKAVTGQAGGQMTLADADALPAQVRQMLAVVLENSRVAALPEIAAQFRARVNEAAGVCECLIESAFPMSEAEVTGLLSALSRKFPLRLLPELRVNPELIGGVRVSVGDRVLDQSVRARLDAMRASLTA